MSPTDPNVAGVLSQVRALLLLGAGILAANGYGDTGAYKWVMIAAGSAVAVGTALWGLYNSLVTLRKSRAQALQAGLNLAASGNSVDHDGNPQRMVGPDSTPPKPVTLASADQIIKAYAPPAASIAKA